MSKTQTQTRSVTVEKPVDMQDAKPTTLDGQWGVFHLLPERAIWWPEQETLFVTDLHLGKDSTFRKHGLAVPSGSTPKCLARLTALISRFPVKRVSILGDLFHAKSSLANQVVEDFSHFLDSHPTVDFKLVKGNHDIHTGRLPASWKLEVLEPPVTIIGVMLTHFPQPPLSPATLCVSGHLHPACRLGGNSAQALGLPSRLPCFFLSQDHCLTVPAFGEFVGTSLVDQKAASRLWLTTDQKVFELPAHHGNKVHL